MTSPSEPGNYRDELDLVDLWLAFQRNIRLVMIVLIVGLLVGVALALFMPRSLDHKLVLEIGGVWAGGPTLSSGTSERFQFIEQPDSVVARIEESYADLEARNFPEAGDDLLGGLEAKARKGSHLVEIVVTAGEKHSAEAETFVASLGDRVLRVHNAALDQRLDVLRSVATERLGELDAQLNALRESRARIAAEEGPAAAGLTLLLVDTEIQELSSERSEVERELKVELKVNVRPTQVLAGPLTAPGGVGPVLSLLISLVVAGFVAMLAVLFVELGAAARRRGR